MRWLVGVSCWCLLVTISVAEEPRATAGSQGFRATRPETQARPELPPFDAVEEQQGSSSQAPSRYQPIPLNRDTAERDPNSSSNNSKNGGLKLTTVLTSLSVVVLLMLGLAKLIAKRNPFVVRGAPRDAIDVIGRRTIDPRNTIYLVRVGAKVLLLGSSSNGLTSLSEITDPIEVATLSSLCRGDDVDQPSFAQWCATLVGRKVPPADSRTFGERFGESLRQDNSVPSVSQVSNSSYREGQHVS